MANASSNTHRLRKSQVMALLVSAALLPLSGAKGQAGAAEEITPTDLIMISSTHESSGNGGGPWIVENPEIVSQGEITRIRVCHGRFINRITVDYNTSGRGTEFGGPGGNCDDFDLEPGVFIREVRTWSGDWMNAIQFVASNKQVSKVFGDPTGGTPQSFIDPNGGALRQVDGKFGAYINQARFSFGLPFKLKDFKIEIPANAYNPKGGELKEIEAIKTSLCEYEPGSTPPAEISKGFTKSVSDSHTFSFGSATTVGLSSTVSVGIPSIGELGVTISAEQQFTFGTTDTTEKSNTRTEDFKYYLPAGRAAEAVFTARATKLNVPFTYKLVHYSAKNPGKELQSKTYRGTYEGVLFSATNVSVYEVDCASSERKTKYPDGATLPALEPKPVQQTAANALTTVKQPDPSSTFTGSWSCPPYGDIDINQSGSGITGSYSWGGRGTFQGDAKDRFMRVAVNDSAGKPLPSFFWELTLSGDGNRVDGKIIDKTETAAWGCSRIGAP